MATRKTSRKSKAQAEAVGFARATRSGNSVVVTLPKAVRETAGIEAGEYLRLAADQNRIVLSKAV